MTATRAAPVGSEAPPHGEQGSVAGAEPTLRFTRARVERIVGVALAFGSIVFGAQAALAAIGTAETGRWHVPLLAATFTALAMLIVTGIAGWCARAGASVFAVVLPIALIVWGRVSGHTELDPAAQPWIWYLITIATAAAVYVFPIWAQVVWTVGVPALYCAVRITQSGGTSAFWVSSIADASFSVSFGFVILLLMWMFRSVADRVDQARELALSSFGRATAAEALEQERVEMAALMHDSVLSALIAAERAETPRERELAVAMTRDALTGLADAEEEVVIGSDVPVSAREVAAQIGAAVAALGASVVITAPAPVMLPGPVARAFSLAATQAATNAVQHAGGVGLEISVQAGSRETIITVRDRGPGIDLQSIPDDRLGLRASVFARMTAVGGDAELATHEHGTEITLRWRP